MTQYFTSEEIFNNTKGLNDNIGHYNDLAKLANLTINVESNIIQTGGSHIREIKEDEVNYIRKVSMGYPFIIYERNKTNKHFNLIRLSNEQIKNIHKILKLDKLKAFL